MDYRGISEADKVQSAVRLVNDSWRRIEPIFNFPTNLFLSLLLQEENNARQTKDGVHNLGDGISTAISVAVYALIFGTRSVG